jgi:MYXO-CTERM domain-containing protein
MKHLLSSVALAAAALCASAPASAAIVFSFTPSATQIAVGDSVTIDATISGLGPEILSAFDLNFVYDPAILQWSLIGYFGATLGHPLGVADNGLPNGNLGFDDSSLDDDATLAANQADSLLLFRFTLSGQTDGATTFTLGASPDFDRNFVGLNFESLNVDVGSVCIAVGTGSCAVPEPASYGLAAIALLAAGAAGRTRRRREVV